jgi:small subunit ribosomal protein S14
MASQCQIAKSKKLPKFSSRIVNRCNICGRARAYYRKFELCRCCFRKLALEGMIPGVRKSSW